MVAAAAIAIAVASAGSACAACRTTAITAAQAQAAAREGEQMGRDRARYDVRRWVLWQSRDPLRAEHGRAGVDAVIAETPYERVRYYAFLYTIQGSRINAPQIESFRRDAEGRLGFLVYAHSKDEEDRTFLRKFAPATLTSGSANLTAPAGEFFGPSQDFYDVGTFREERWVGSFTYRFSTRACIDSATLTFADAYGDRQSVRVKLSAVPH